MIMAGFAVTGKSAFLMRQDARDMPENEKAGAYAPAFCVCEKSFREMLLVRLWEDDAEADKEGCRPRLLTTGESLPAFCLAVRSA